MYKDYTVGKYPPSWNEGNAQTITFIVTEDCNLRCKYCYISHKASEKRMSFETAKQFIDYLLNGDLHREKAVILDFIGGEPMMETELIDQICDYFKLATFEMNDPWFWNYRISISTNGINYSDDNVQKFIKKNENKISIGITVDGTKEKHDLQRVFPDGSGSYDIISKNIPLWQEQIQGQTKVTFASADLVYLKDSILSLWERGIHYVAANVVFEDVWNDGDDKVFEQQLIELADYVLDNKLFDKYYCTLFSDTIGGYYDESDLSSSYCGAGKMLAVGPDGIYYPCLRYKDYSLNRHPEWPIGSNTTPIDMEKIRPFILSTTKYQSEEKCINCEVAIGCGVCQGHSYDESTMQTNFYRATYICEMHKARVRANDYYFSKLFNIYGIQKDDNQKERKKMKILLSDDYVNFCGNIYEKALTKNLNLSEELLPEALEYARRFFYEPIIIHNNNSFTFKPKIEYDRYLIKHILPLKFFYEAKNLGLKKCIFVINSITFKDLEILKENIDTCIFNIDSSEIASLSKFVVEIFKKARRIELNVMNVDNNFDEKLYFKELELINEHLLSIAQENNLSLEVNVLTDLINLKKHNNCKAGDREITCAPNGMLYVCPAFYTKNSQQSIGSISSGLDEIYDNKLFKKEFQPLCQECDAFHCKNCSFINKEKTNEVNVSPSYECRKSYIERENTRLLLESISSDTKIESIDFYDPIEKTIKSNNLIVGYYQY